MVVLGTLYLASHDIPFPAQDIVTDLHTVAGDSPCIGGPVSGVQLELNICLRTGRGACCPHVQIHCDKYEGSVEEHEKSAQELVVLTNQTAYIPW